MDWIAIYNAVEAAWWGALGAGVLIAKGRDETRAYRRWLGAGLVAFGVSDIIEIWTGAWWQPWSLAALKVVCGIVIVIVAVLWFRRARAR
jgi:hypothetical protein